MSRLYHQEHPAGSLEGCHEILKRVGSVEVFAGAASCDEFVDFLYGTVVHAHAEAFAFHVEDEVLAHDCQADEADV